MVTKVRWRFYATVLTEEVKQKTLALFIRKGMVVSSDLPKGCYVITIYYDPKYENLMNSLGNAPWDYFEKELDNWLFKDKFEAEIGN